MFGKAFNSFVKGILNGPDILKCHKSVNLGGGGQKALVGRGGEKAEKGSERNRFQAGTMKIGCEKRKRGRSGSLFKQSCGFLQSETQDLYSSGNLSYQLK